MPDTQGAPVALESRISLRGALGWFVASYGVAVLGYLALYAMASRFLGPDSFGSFVIAVTATTLVGQFALVGVHRSGLREAARLGADDGAEIALLRQGVRSVSLTTLPLAAVLAGAVTWVLRSGDSPGERASVSVGIAALVLLSGHQMLWANYLRGFGNIRFASLLEGRAGGALVAVLQSAFLALVWIFFPDLGLGGALGAVALGYLLPVIAAHHVVARKWRGHPMQQPSLLRDLRRVVDRDWRFASGQLAAYLNANLELWMAGALLSLVDTSMFGAAQRLALLVVIPLTSLQVVFAPVIARAGASGDLLGLETLVRTGATLAAIPMAIILIPVIVAPGAVLGLVFGSEYDAAAPILLLLTVGSVANVLTGLCGAVLSMTHREGTVALVQWTGVGARVVCGVLAATYLGVNGLGASAGIITAGIWISLWLAAYRKAGVFTHLTFRPKARILRETTG